MANVNLTYAEWTPSQILGPRVPAGSLNFFITQPVAPTLTVLAPLGGSIGAQLVWKARLTLAEVDGHVQRIIIGVQFPATGVFEIAYLDSMASDYSGQSSVVETSPGVFDISIIRNGGWPASPRLFVHANTDRGGMTQ